VATDNEDFVILACTFLIQLQSVIWIDRQTLTGVSRVKIIVPF